MPRVERLAYLFGSLTEGSDRSDDADDVDLAVLTGGDPAHVLKADLTRALGTSRIDLVDLRRASPRLRFDIVRHGCLLYARDDETLNRFELATLHLYRDTAPLRRRHRRILRERMRAWS